jgi:dihydropteroate synthase
MAASLQDILQSHRLRLPVVMGVLNVTPDSFSDPGRFLDPQASLAHAGRMVAEGADLIDVGAESSRPGSDRVGAGEQIRRLRGILPALVGLGVPVSIDTTRASVARFALEAGAVMINDISAGRDDPGMFPLAAESRAAMTLMHMLGQPKSMQEQPHYDDVVRQVSDFLAGRLKAAGDAGVAADRLIVDPGIGFGKMLEHNLALLAGLRVLAGLGRPVMVGVSRKRFIGALTGQDQPQDRLFGTLGAVLAGWWRGATIFRVHDVAAAREALTVAAAVDRAGPAGPAS